ncbi:MAG: diacylglycerol kinase family lipid kinase [Bacteroidales bacterium]|nr:diacylglycerol kinase family lipid kinase [Candidatus Cryptobacteroides onthequi]
MAASIMSKKILFIVNPISGGKEKSSLVDEITSFCQNHDIDFEVTYTQGKGHAAALAKETDAEVVVAVGGDGTINDVASAIINTDKTMGIIPVGSGNGLARHLGITKRNALQNLCDGKVINTDCGEMNGHVFCCTCGTGLDAQIGARFAKKNRRGFLSYVESSIEAWNHFKPEAYEVEIDGEKIYVEATMITIGNANQWGNNAFITPQASILDGMLDIAVVSNLNLLEMSLFLDFLMTKRLHKSHFVQYYKGKQICITRRQAEDVHYDGEPDMLGQKLDIKILEGSLKLIVPVSKTNRL